MMALLLIISLPLSACTVLVKGSGVLKTEEFAFDDFSAIAIDGPFEVDINYADSYSISVTADDNIFENLEINKEEGTFNLRLAGAQYVNITAKAVITVPHLRSLKLDSTAECSFKDYNSRAGLVFEISGASSLDLDDIAAGDVKFNVSGASEIAGEITAGDVEFNIDGASNGEVEGTASNLKCNIDGASQLGLGDFVVDNADMKMRGASSCTINLDGKLDVDLGGDSDLSYYGNPVMGDTKISGDSTMTRK